MYYLYLLGCDGDGDRYDNYVRLIFDKKLSYPTTYTTTIDSLSVYFDCCYDDDDELFLYAMQLLKQLRMLSIITLSIDIKPCI